MKNILKVFGFIALVAVIVFSLTAATCGGNKDGGGTAQTSGGGSGGTLTVTGIPTEHNGKYAFFMGAKSGVSGLTATLVGSQSYSVGGDATLVQIANGSVSLPMWTFAGSKVVGYSGNDVGRNGLLHISNSSTVNINNPTEQMTTHMLGEGLGFITFSNGSATVTWKEY